MGIPIGGLKPASTIIYNKELYIVLTCEHSRSGRGAAFCRTKLRNLRNAQILECTLRDSDNIQQAFVEKRKLQYLYIQNDLCHFLDLETYEDLILQESHVADKTIWFKDNLELNGLFYNNDLLDLEIPLTLKLKVIETTPGFRGNTVKQGTKPAKLETGININVPLFITTGDTVKVDTRTKEYLERT